MSRSTYDFSVYLFVVVVVYLSSRFPCRPRPSSCYLHVLPGKRVNGFSLQIIMWISVVVSAQSHSSRGVYTRYCHIKTHSPVCTVSFDHSSWLHHDLGNDIKRPAELHSTSQRVVFNELTVLKTRQGYNKTPHARTYIYKSSAKSSCISGAVDN